MFRETLHCWILLAYSSILVAVELVLAFMDVVPLIGLVHGTWRSSFSSGEWLSLPEEASWEFGSSDSRQPMSVDGLEYEHMSLPRCSRFLWKGNSLSGWGDPGEWVFVRGRELPGHRIHVWWTGLPTGESDSWSSGSVGVGVVEFWSNEGAMLVIRYALFCGE